MGSGVSGIRLDYRSTHTLLAGWGTAFSLIPDLRGVGIRDPGRLARSILLGLVACLGGSLFPTSTPGPADCRPSAPAVTFRCSTSSDSRTDTEREVIRHCTRYCTRNCYNCSQRTHITRVEWQSSLLLPDFTDKWLYVKISAIAGNIETLGGRFWGIFYRADSSSHFWKHSISIRDGRM